MRWLAGGLTFVNISVVSAVLLGLAASGLGRGVAFFATLIGVFFAVWAILATAAPSDSKPVVRRPWSRVWFWVLAGCFAFFAFRAFCWLIFIDGNQLKVQSPNNLGDLALHFTYIRNLASGVPLWPENPIYAFSHLRYPVGTDLFNSLLVLLGFDLLRGLIWAGLLGSLATFYALYRWGGSFGLAAFLFNGGTAGFQLLQTWSFMDYQGDKSIAWKSLPLAMFVTQRGLLYALPAGLLLLYQWRAKYFQGAAFSKTPSSVATPNDGVLENAAPCPLWVEVSLYATMPFFHLHTFMALSIVAAFLFIVGDASIRKQLGLLAGIAFLPATFLVWTITDHFKARSLMEWKPGWVQTVEDFRKPFLLFWFENFGILLPLVLLLVGFLLYRAWKSFPREKPTAAPSSLAAEARYAGSLVTDIFRRTPALAFITPAALIFLFAYFVKTAPWGWDNIKLILWAYLITVPFLWRELIAHWDIPVRVGVCFALFASGFISLFGGLLHDPEGYGFADRAELDAVGVITAKLPVAARYAAYPTYNHPLLLQGRKLVLGYPGHLWTQGFDYGKVSDALGVLMNGSPDWRKQARELRVRYIFWGREEKANYAQSTRPWEREAKLVASGAWGAIYDVETPAL